MDFAVLNPSYAAEAEQTLGVAVQDEIAPEDRMVRPRTSTRVSIARAAIRVPVLRDA